MLYDLFICHASEDKESFVRPLAAALREQNVEVWYDEFSLKLGDSIRRSIDRGLSQSRFGVVVLSKAFFEKRWPQYELDGLAEREMKGEDKILLPIWHGVNHDDVMAYSPALAGRKAASSSEGMNKVVDEILAVIHPQGSPLIVARDALIEWGFTPPVITDEYWLDVVEASNRVPGYGPSVPEESSWSTWSFPLPPKEGGASQRGERLAWTAMQMNWVKSAEDIPITPLTRPQEVLEFIHSHPGLYETCVTYPDLVAEYAPQLTIPGFGGEIENALEEAYKKSCQEAAERRAVNSRFCSALTSNDKSPLCDEEWSLRHPTFGDYEPVHVTNAYFRGGMFGPSVSPYEHSDHAFWLLSTASAWLPRRIRSVLIEGMTSWNAWVWAQPTVRGDAMWETNGALLSAFNDAVDGKSFRWTSRVSNDVLNRIKLSIKTLGLPDSPEEILDRFLTHEFPEKYIRAEKRYRHRRSGEVGRKAEQTKTNKALRPTRKKPHAGERGR